MSYAHNQEDIICQQILADVSNGFYLDIGAFLPVYDSNTFVFYEKGWSGIVVEPLACIYQEIVERWVTERPRDMLVRGMCADYNGEHDFYPCHAHGQCSTGSKKILTKYVTDSDTNIIGEPSKVPCWTLNFLLDHKAYSEREIHLMSIDTEGMENEVLRGFDLKRYRPWLIVVENTIPGPLTASDFDAKRLLDYHKIHDDGVNGFYLADEHSELWE